MANLIAVATSSANRHHPAWTADDIDSLYEDLYSRSAGKLVTRLKALVDDPGHLDLFSRAVAERNRLVHHYFREHDRDAMTAAGMQRMLDHADQARAMFIAADEAASVVTYDLFQKMGIGVERIRAEYEALIAHARHADGDYTTDE